MRFGKTPTPSKVLVVLGMHRAGTSLVTQWLHRCGLNVGERLLGASVGNLDGHFEDMDLFRFHQGCLEEFDLPTTGFVQHPLPRLSGPKRRQLEEIIADRNARFAEWGWKEPRTCLFLDEYREILPCAHYLVVWRGFRETVGSMISRRFKLKDDKHAGKGRLSRLLWFKIRRNAWRRRFLTEEANLLLQTWLLYNRLILDFLKHADGQRHAVVDCRLLLQDDERVFRRMRDEWKFSLRPVAFADVYKPERMNARQIDIDRFVDASSLVEAEAIERELDSLTRDAWRT